MSGRIVVQAPSIDDYGTGHRDDHAVKQMERQLLKNESGICLKARKIPISGVAPTSNT